MSPNVIHASEISENPQCSPGGNKLISSQVVNISSALILRICRRLFAICGRNKTLSTLSMDSGILGHGVKLLYHLVKCLGQSSKSIVHLVDRLAKLLDFGLAAVIDRLLR